MARKLSLFDLAMVVGLLALLVFFFWPVVLGGRTLLPLDNLFSAEPWRTFADQFGIDVPHNGLLSDLILENYVWKRFIVQALQNGRLPLWNPFILSGQPFLAAGQHSALYPLSLVFYVLPLASAYGYFTVLQLLLAGVFMYVYARTIRLERFGAAVSAVVYTFSGFMIVSVVHPMIIAAASWLPLLLATVERLVRTQEAQWPEQEPRPVAYIPWIVLGAVVLALQFLAGHVEIAYYVVLVTAFYGLCRLGLLWWDHRDWVQLGKLGLGVLLILTLGLGLAAIQMIPLYELVTGSFRQESASYQQVVGWSYHWRRLIAFLVPDFFGNPTHHSYFDVFSRQAVTTLRNAQGDSIDTIYWGIKNYVEGGSYVGILPLLLGFVAVWKSRTRYVWMFLALALVSLLFVFGTPLYAVLYHLLPGVSQLHSPFRWVFPYTLSVSILAGCGASWLAKNASRSEGRSAHVLGGLVLAVGMLGLGGLTLSLGFPETVSAWAERAMFSLAGAPGAFFDGRAFYSYQFRNLLIFFLALAGGGLALLLTGSRIRLGRVPLWQALTMAVIVSELFIVGMGFNPAADPAVMDLEPPVVSFLRQDSGLWRLTTFCPSGEKTFDANAGMFYDFEDVRGYDSIISKQYVDYMELVEPQGELLYNRIAPLKEHSSLDSPLVDLLNVKYVVTAQVIDNANYTLVYNRELRVYRNEDYLPRAFVVHRAQVVPDENARRDALRKFDPRQVVILEGLPEVETSQDAPEGWEPATITRYDPNEVLIELDLQSGGYLVLADSYSRGWKAYDTQPGSDEQEIPIYRANGNFRAVVLGPGRHTVRFKYTPFSLKLGLFISFLAGIILVLLMSYWLWRRFYREELGDTVAKRVAKNALTPMALSLVNRLIDMAFSMLTLRILAPERAGRYQFAYALIGYFETVILFGLGTLVTREIAKHKTRANRYVSNSVMLRLLLWAASVPAVAALIYAYTRWSGLATDTVWAILLFFVALLPASVSDALSAVFSASEKMEYPAAIASVTTLLRVTLGTMALLLGYGFVGLAATSLVVNLVTTVVLGALVTRMFFRPIPEFDLAFGRTMMHASFPLMLNSLLAKVFFQVDVLLLKPLRGDLEVGYYGTAYQYIRGLDIIPSYFTLAIFPLMSRLAESQRDSLARAYVLSVKLLVMVALPIAVGTTFIARELILLLAGADYMPHSMIALQLLIWYMPIGFVNSVTQYVLIAINQQRFLTRAFLIGAGFNVLSNLVFIPRYGYAAAAVVTVLSEVALLIPFYYRVRKHLTALPWLEVYWRPCAAAAVMGGTMWLLRGTTVLLQAPVGVIVYLAVLAALGTFRQPDLALVMELLPERWKKRVPHVLGGS